MPRWSTRVRLPVAMAAMRESEAPAVTGDSAGRELPEEEAHGAAAILACMVVWALGQLMPKRRLVRTVSMARAVREVRLVWEAPEALAF